MGQDQPEASERQGRTIVKLTPSRGIIIRVTSFDKVPNGNSFLTTLFTTTIITVTACDEYIEYNRSDSLDYIISRVKGMEERNEIALFSDLPGEACLSAPTKNTEPFLPPELERHIFEFAAYSRNVRRVDLMLVARRVHHWLRHIPFLVFVQLDSETFPDFDKADSGLDLKAMGQYCRHLLTEEDFSGSSSSDKDDTEDDQKPITLTESEPERPKTVTLLQSCPNVQNLALWFGFPIAHYLPYIENMPLQMLSADLSSLSQDQLSLKLFQKLTHLDVVDFSGNDNWKFLEGWNNLTHLAFNFEVDRVAVLDVLAFVKNLKAFVLVRNQVNWTNMDPEVLDNGDPRLVLMIIAGRAVVGDWKEGARGNVDFWVFGDWVVEARHRSYFIENKPQWHELVQWMSFGERLSNEGKKWFTGIREYYKESAEADPARI